MPCVLTERFRPDSIAELQASARLRWTDAQRLLAAGRESAAIYLLGYGAETTIKAPSFRHLGFSPRQAISPANLHTAVNMGTTVYGIARPAAGRLHNIPCWVQLVVRHGVAQRGAYSDPNLALLAVRHGRQIYARWRESLRYKSNRPYHHEVATVRVPVSWMLDNADAL